MFKSSYHRKTFIHTIILGVTCVSLIMSGSTSEQEETVQKAGFAEHDITPELGMEKPGGYGKSYHREFHDPCKVRAVVFDDGKQKAALVGVDGLMVPRHLVKSAREKIQEQCGIPPEAVMIGASHSHAAGPLGMIQPGQFDWASPLIQSLAYEKSSTADAEYLKEVENAVADAVVMANANLKDAICGVGIGIEDKVAFNRRFHMKNSLVYTHPGKGNPDSVKVAGPTDPEVGVIGVWDQQDDFKGCIVNYACHATGAPRGISASWIYYVEKVIRGVMGKDAIVVFLAGFSGDVTQVDNLSKYAEREREDTARFVGSRIGAEAVKALVGMEKGSLVPVDTKSKVLQMERRQPDPERVKSCMEIVQQGPKKAGSTEWTFAKEILLLDAILSKQPKAEVELQAVQIGPAIYLSAPGEMFCQLGLDIKEGSPFPFTFPVSLANGCVGYIPTEKALGEHGGGYETRLTSYSNLRPDAGSIMREQLIEFAKEMKPGEQPMRPKAAPFRQPWRYGNVPPELK